MMKRSLLALLLVLGIAAHAQTREPEPTPIPVPIRPGWLIDAKSKCSVWEGAPQPGETIVWAGGCKDKLADGDGGILRVLIDGKQVELYIGDYRRGKKEGRGVYTWENHDRYDGGWKDDLQDGKGTMTFGSGGRYVGQWKDGKPDGAGVSRYPPTIRPSHCKTH